MVEKNLITKAEDNISLFARNASRRMDLFGSSRETLVNGEVKDRRVLNQSKGGICCLVGCYGKISVYSNNFKG